MKIFKKITSAVLAIAMIVTLCAVNPTKTEAAVTILYGKKLTLTVGETDEIDVKQKGATFTSSNKKVATVSKKGKVKGKKAGTCKITVKVGSSKKTVPITVKPKKVTIKSATLTSTTSAKVTWKKVTGATGYYVYRSTKKSSGYKKAATVKGAKKTSAVIKGLALGKTYYFKVKAYAKSGKKTLTSSSYSAVKSVKTWKMVWNDEFGGTKLDTKKWNTNGATGAGGYGNYELQNYQPQYSEVKNGTLIIKPQFQWNATTKRAVDDSYYSTKLWTRGQYSVKYGKIEFRAKMPKGQGTWAAGWMLGNNFSWPQCGEIDVFETTFDLAKQTIPQSLHMPKFNGMSTSSGNKHWDSKISNATSAYHTYGVIWTDRNITFTIDGKVRGTYDPNDFVFDGKGTSYNNIWPFNQNFYLILNCAIGGVLGGSVAPTYWTKVASTTNAAGQTIETYRDYFYIDWVRVYQ